MIDSIRELLIKQARMRVLAPVNYDTIMQQIGLDHKVPRDRDQLSEELAEISRFEHTKKRPMLSSMAMYAGLKTFGGGFYKLAEELGYGNEKELQRREFGKEMQKRCREFWVNDDNYKRFFNDTSDESAPEFFNGKELDFFHKWADVVYDKDDPKHVSAKDELMDSVWDKTVYWSKQLAGRLEGFENSVERKWSQRGRDDSSGENKPVSKFKHYTWARIYKTADRGKGIFFTFGVHGRNKSLLYKLDYYSEKESSLSAPQRELCEQLIPDEVSWLEIPYEQVLKYNWEKLLDETEGFIRDNSSVYDEIIKSVWSGSVRVSKLKNRLIKRETPKHGLTEIPKRQFSFKGHNTDWEIRQRENASLGELGEVLVIEYEKKQLKKDDMNELSKDVRRAKDGEGYDIFSRHKDGRPKYIEVKSTNENDDTPFLITLNEIEFSKLNQESYYLYRLFNLKKETRVAEFHEYYGDVRVHFLLEETVFNAHRKNRES